MKVFISHSRQNAGAALKLCDRLRLHGVQPWLDLQELDSGADWSPRVAAAIREADGFVFLIGPSERPDQGQRYEWQQITEEDYYLDPDKPLIPILIGDIKEVPGFLQTRNAVRVAESSIDFDALGAAIADALGKPSETVDRDKVERGRAARQQALDRLKEYAVDLEREDIKRAGLRAK